MCVCEREGFFDFGVCVNIWVFFARRCYGLNRIKLAVFLMEIFNWPCNKNVYASRELLLSLFQKQLANT